MTGGLMREGSLEAPTRHPIAWQDPDFSDPAKIEAELKRVFEICHGCRRCFNLCDSFPRLFDLIDAGASGEVDGVAPGDYGKVVEACTLCDLCFMTKCPYVPPHAFNVDFPHLMLRARASGMGTEGESALGRQMVETDRNGKLGAALSPLANWATATGNHLTRPAMEKFAGVDRRAELPKFHGKTFVMRARLRSQGRALRHLLRQLQQPAHRRSAARGAGLQRGRNRGDVSRLLRHAAIRAGRSGARRRQRAARGPGVETAYRAGPRHRRAGAVLRADAQIRMALALARGRRREAAGARHLRRQRIPGRYRQEGRAGAGLEAA